jgi:hypothetical protein
MWLYDVAVPQPIKMLRNLDAWLGAANAYADRRRFDVDTLMKARLAPDQFSLDRQIQTTCDNAKFFAGRIAGKDWPTHPDVETAIAELRTRIANVIAYLETFSVDDFAGAAERRISLPWMDGKWMRGDEYATQFAVPNLYFHFVTTYAILRHNGVELGKRDYIGGVPMRA